MNSTQLIELYESLKQQLGEKATDWNMFLEGYVAGINDTNVKKQIVDKVCEWLKEHASNYGYAESDLGDATYHYNVDELVRALTIAMES